MSFDDPAVRPLLELEGLRQWRPGRTTGTTSSRPPSIGSASTAPTVDQRRRLPAVTRRSCPSSSSTTLGFDGGAHVLVKLALADLDERRRDRGRAAPIPSSPTTSAAWCRQQGHRGTAPTRTPTARSGSSSAARAAGARWVGAERPAGPTPPTRRGAVATTAGRVGPRRAGCSHRARRPGEPDFRLDHRDRVWTDRAPTLYAQAAAAQWDPDTAIDWSAALDHDGRRRGRRRAGDDIPHRERGSRARRARPFPRPDPPPLPGDPAGPRGHRRRRSSTHRGVHPPRHHHRRTNSHSRPLAAGPHCRPSRRTRLSPPPASCSRSWARAPSCRY